MSYKKPFDSNSNIKKEIEYEINVSDFDNAKKIIEAMGFFPVSSYERYRTTFERDNVKIMIDEFPFANFVEVEGDEVDVVNVSKELGFNIEDSLSLPCDTLFQKWRKERGLQFKEHLTFEDFDK